MWTFLKEVLLQRTHYSTDQIKKSLFGTDSLQEIKQSFQRKKAFIWHKLYAIKLNVFGSETVG